MNDMTGVTRAKRDDASKFPLESASPEELGFDVPALSRLRQLIASHIADGRYPGAQIALARHGRLALFESFGQTSLEPAAAAGAQALWLLFSNTKVITAAGIWALVEDGALRFSDRIAEHMPDFARHGKGDITLAQVISIVPAIPAKPCHPRRGRIMPRCAGKSATSRSSGRRVRACITTRSRHFGRPLL